MMNRTHLYLILIIFISACKKKHELLNDDYKSIEYCEVKEILEKSCLKCHSDNGFAPFSFYSTGYFKNKKSTILQVLENGIMPPWKPDIEYSQFKNQYGLSKDELSKLYTWVYYDANDSKKCDFTSINNQIILNNEKKGDCFQFSNGYIVPENNDHYKCFNIVNPYKEDVYLSSIDLIPGNNRIIHHISAFWGKLPEGLDEEKLQYYDCDQEIDENSKLVSNWSMGSFSTKYEDGRGFFFPKNSYLSIQVHFTDGSKGFVDSSYVCFNKADYPINEEVYYSFENKFDISFEPNEIKFDTLVVEVEQDISMLSIWPHTHRIAVFVECYAYTPLMKKINLVRIPKWDYFWHSSYEFIEPVNLPKGSKIYMVVKFDNTTNNKLNPFSPPRKIIYGRGSKDEMLTLAYSYVLAKK